MTPEELDTKFESFCGLVLEKIEKIDARIERVEGLLTNYVANTGMLAHEVHRLNERVSQLERLTTPCPPPMPNGHDGSGE